MACMEHTCCNCGHTEFDNKPKLKKCMECGSSDIQSNWDEQGSYGDYGDCEDMEGL